MLCSWFICCMPRSLDMLVLASAAATNTPNFAPAISLASALSCHHVQARYWSSQKTPPTSSASWTFPARRSIGPAILPSPPLPLLPSSMPRTPAARPAPRRHPAAVTSSHLPPCATFSAPPKPVLGLLLPRYRSNHHHPFPDHDTVPAEKLAIRTSLRAHLETEPAETRPRPPERHATCARWLAPRATRAPAGRFPRRAAGLGSDSESLLLAETVPLFLTSPETGSGRCLPAAEPSNVTVTARNPRPPAG